MVDIYEHELKIPQKPRAAGWLFLGIGLVMVLVAVFIYMQQCKEVAKYKRPPQERAKQIKQAPVKPLLKTQGTKNAVRLFWWTVLAGGSLFALILIFTVLHRLAGRLRSMAKKKQERAKCPDPWEESARRMPIPPESADE